MLNFFDYQLPNDFDIGNKKSYRLRNGTKSVIDRINGNENGND